ncbi:glycosyltransferase family 2 protein [Chryseobacterium sp. RG1]|uniref:Glycosyltransferase family 2 protein n=1 Tax=Chryseobacterium tagetis TaxID=2801334 RepID=A0ABS7ZZE5_9FLAO|nr:glycosyltransferase [Chryseobacterium tagetis]MCA6067102.1 glycosyltransferase family 2 protein [Chryseobacterium tagetis]
MKLSICIPVYNFDVRELVLDLKKEIEDNEIDAEIILIDDASEENFKIINSNLQSEVQKFIFLENNIGRSKIRNLFLDYTKGDYLLFLDCDVKIDNTNFLLNYLNEIEKNFWVELIYGNFKIDTLYSKSLRNRYSVEREIFYEERSSDFSLFKTVNFIIKRKIFESFLFDERLRNYGYEDFVFAKLLESNQIKYFAFNNPVIHFDDTSNSAFLKKVDIGIDSLCKLSKDEKSKNFIKDIKVYDTAVKLRKIGVDSLVLFLYNFLNKIIKNNLLSENPSIKYLDIYKLNLLLKKMKAIS